MRVGKPHGLDGSFHTNNRGQAPFFQPGAPVVIGGREYTIEATKGTDANPIVKLAGVDGRDAAEALRGEEIRRDDLEPAGEGEWLVDDLVGCRIEGVGEVTGVLAGVTCDVLEAGGHLIPLVSDAVTSVDVERRVIEVNREFLGL